MGSLIDTILDINTMDALVISLCASIMSVVLTIVSLCVTKINKDAKTRKIRRRIPDYKPPVTRRFSFITNILITLTLICVTCLVTTLAVCHEANIRTIPYDTLSLRELPEKIQTTLAEDQVPDDIRNQIIIFYKYGCPDCESIHKWLERVKDHNKENVLFVASNSKQGEKLRETLPVTDVPCGFYIHSDGSYTNILLYVTDESGTHFDQQAMDRLFQLQSEKR